MLLILNLMFVSDLDCNDGDIQLSGGESDNEGTVEVCYDNIWGLISEERLD